MAAPTLHQLLGDVAAGLVTYDPSMQWIGIPNTVPVEDGETYRLAVLDAVNRSQVGLTGDGNVLVLSTLGEHLYRCGNPGRYQSTNAIEVRDGRFTTRVVAS
jgi:hypothetical protein